MSKRNYFVRNQWRERVNPAFARYWAATKANRALLKIKDPREREKAFRRTVDELTAASQELQRQKVTDGIAGKIWPAIIAGLDGEGKFTVDDANKRYTTNPESSALFRDLVFLKYGITYRELMVEVRKDKSNYRKLLRVHEDFHRFLAGIAGFDGLKLKFNLNHFQIMVQGLDLGLLALNEWELAACFDEICPCGQKHSVEYLKKFRVRVKKACEHLLSSAQKPTTIDISEQAPSS